MLPWSHRLRQYVLHRRNGVLRSIPIFKRSSSNHYISVDRQKDVAILRFGDKDSEINCSSIPLFNEFIQKIEHLEKDTTVSSVVVISNKPNCFIAGADVKMFTTLASQSDAEKLSSEAQSMMRCLETSRKPIVAAIMGSCLGTGLELALACQYRIAVDSRSTVFGLPEVELGMLPGSGGIQRLFRSCSRFEKALELIIKGTTLTVHQAKQLGLVHQVVYPLGPGIMAPTENTLNYLESVAVECARDLTLEKVKISPKHLLHRMTLELLSAPFIPKLFFNLIRKKVLRETHGLYPAPKKIVDLCELYMAKGSSVGYEMESKLFGELAMTNESKALVGLFLGRTFCKKQRLPPPKQSVRQLGVVGAGLMGAGIVQVSLQHGIPTVMKDVSSPNLFRGEAYIQSNFSDLVNLRRMSQLDSQKKFSLLESTLDLNALRNVDMVIEAVFEDLSLKQRIVKEVEAVLLSNAIFASNTSALPIHTIAEASERPDKFIGMHYFSPVGKMQLLELIATDKTSQDTIASAMDLGLRQGKAVITVKDGPGFYTTRLLGPVLFEILQLLQEGVSPTELNRVSETFGWPVGMATLADKIGVDVAFHVSDTLSRAFPSRMKGGDSHILKDLVSIGLLGCKVNNGIFSYKKLGVTFENREALAVFEKYRMLPKVGNSSERINFRLFCRIVNEAVLCLQDGILINGPLEGDIGAVLGLGFPAYLGGPFRYLDLHGAAGIVKRMEEFRSLYGDQFTPCQLLLDHAKDEQKRFHTS